MDQSPGLPAQLPLLHYRFRYAGFLLTILGFGAAYLYFWGGRPDFFEVPVYAIVTSYVETRWFVMAQTNLLDELAFLLILSGLLTTGFSKLKIESEYTQQIRIKCLFYSIYATSVLWGIVYITVYGWPVIVVTAFMFAAFLLIHNILLWGHLTLFFKKISANKNVKTGVLYEKSTL